MPVKMHKMENAKRWISRRYHLPLCDTTGLQWKWFYTMEINRISKNNFPVRKTLHQRYHMEWHYPADIIVIKRSALLKYIFTIDPKKERNKLISCHIDTIKDKFPIIDTLVKMFMEFHEIIMGKAPDAIDGYIEKYQKTKISGFCDGIKKNGYL